MTSAKGVLLDVDGTLVNSNDAHARAYVDALKEFGYDVPFERVRPLIGMGGDELLPELIGVAGDSKVRQDIDARCSEIFKTRYLPEISAFPGVRALLERFTEDGLSLIAASSSGKDTLAALLELADVSDLLSEQTSSSDADASKPHPDILSAALDKLSLPADQALFLGDTPYDLQAAAPLGLGVIAFRCGGWGDADLQGALAIYDGPQDLLTNYETSPFARQRA